MKKETARKILHVFEVDILKMMKPKRSFYVFVLLVILSKSAAHHKRMMAKDDPYKSFSNNINTCLFKKWPKGVLSGYVACSAPDVQLCYGPYNGERALFAVCYSKSKLIPKFTAHELQKDGTVGKAEMIAPPGAYDKSWKTDEGLVAMKTPVAAVDDYDPYKQAGKFENYKADEKYGQFLAKGHLSPDGDFSKINGENSFTFVTTNAAPQWQLFNSGNWANLETAVRTYANQERKKKQRSVLYVFTGTGGLAKYNNAYIKVNNKVLTPKYFWKAVCEPEPIKQSIVFVAENKPGEVDPTKVAGCNNQKQTKKLGIIQCFSLNDAKKYHPDFKLPPFAEKCGDPAKRGTFLDKILQTKLK